MHATPPSQAHHKEAKSIQSMQDALTTLEKEKGQVEKEMTKMKQVASDKASLPPPLSNHLLSNHLLSNHLLSLSP